MQSAHISSSGGEGGEGLRANAARSGGIWQRALLAAAPPAVALWSALRHGPYLIDDAYITFRYAENLAAGHGLVFNPGEAVLGTSTPLFAGLLSLFALCGVDVPFAARGLGLASVVLVVVGVQRLAAAPLGTVGAAAVGFCLALHPDLAFTANSGMETGLSMAAVYGAMLLALDDRHVPAGLVAGAAFLLRPDGLLAVVLVACVTLLRHPQRTWRVLMAAGLVCLPWLIYATITYGSVIPHSVTAKQLIHPASPLDNLTRNLRWITSGLGMKLVSGLAMVGLTAAAIRRPPLLLVGAWVLLYLAGLSASRITLLFPWYVTPLFPGLVLLAGYGVASLAAPSRLPFQPPAIGSSVARFFPVLVLLALGALLFQGGARWRSDVHDFYFGKRAQDYLEIGAALRERCDPGDVVFVGETGAIAYALLEQRILDSSGINSPEVLRAREMDRRRLLTAGKRAGDPEGSPAWVLEIVDRFRPRYLVTHRMWLHVGKLMGVPRVRKAYRRLALPALDDYVVLERVAENG